MTFIFAFFDLTTKSDTWRIPFGARRWGFDEMVSFISSWLSSNECLAFNGLWLTNVRQSVHISMKKKKGTSFVALFYAKRRSWKESIYPTGKGGKPVRTACLENLLKNRQSRPYFTLITQYSSQPHWIHVFLCLFCISMVHVSTLIF